MKEDDLRECEEALGRRFEDRSLLELALTHSSMQVDSTETNERLEFLGDAVLGWVVSEMLYDRFPEAREGDLSKLRAALVSRSFLAERAKELGLDRWVRLGKGMPRSRLLPVSVRANLYEAAVAALYLDGGVEEARRFVRQTVEPHLPESFHGAGSRNYKSLLQEWTQKRRGTVPEYDLLLQTGPDHNKRFRVRVRIGAEEYGMGEGKSKKEAEQAAAWETLRQLGGINPI